jgi:hypothetical protein
MRNVSDKNCRENQNTILYSITPPLPESPTFYEIMWKNMVESGRPQMTIWRMCSACCIPKAKHPHSENVILIASAGDKCYVNAL